MIELQNINKSYGSQYILKNFSYTFLNSGFYLVFGRSGSGKTTLINIISGIIDYDSGSYLFGNHEIKGKEDQGLIRNNLSYLSQDVYFVDYLTIRENYELSCIELETYVKLTKKFHIGDYLDCYPCELSAGQMQRLAIVQALASHKQVLILDEPTAALDKENKKLVFQLLKKVSKDILVICVSHDVQAKEYSDEVLDLSNPILEYRKYDKKKETIIIQEKKHVSLDLYPYVKKMRNKKEMRTFTTSCLVIIFTLVLLLTMNIYDPEFKLIQTMGEDYHLNYANIDVPVEHRELLLEKLKKDYPEIKDIAYEYRRGADYQERPDCMDCYMKPVSYSDSLVYETLPLGTSFYYRDYLLAGSYFNNSNEIMLGYHKALELSSDPAKLVNKSIDIDTPKGKEKFVVSGIFKEFTEEEEPYFQNGYSVPYINYVVYFNDEYTQYYLSDKTYSNEEKDAFHKGSFIVYFDDFAEMMSFTEENKSCQFDDESCISVIEISSHLAHIIEDFLKVSIILIPCLILSLFMCVLFYCQTKIKQLYQSKHVMCVYQYFGYKQKDVMKAYKKYYRHEIICIICISICLSLVIAFVCNQVLTFTIYPLFTITPLVCVVCGFFFFIICNTCMIILVNRMKKTDWYELMKERRDLL